MTKIIEFPKNHMRYMELVEHLENSQFKKYSQSDIASYAKWILDKSSDYFVKEIKRPDITKIIIEFGISIYKSEIEDDIDGLLIINANTTSKFNTEKLIIINHNLYSSQKRIVLAYLLAIFVLLLR